MRNTCRPAHSCHQLSNHEIMQSLGNVHINHLNGRKMWCWRRTLRFTFISTEPEPNVIMGTHTQPECPWTDDGQQQNPPFFPAFNYNLLINLRFLFLAYRTETDVGFCCCLPSTSRVDTFCLLRCFSAHHIVIIYLKKMRVWVTSDQFGPVWSFASDHSHPGVFQPSHSLHTASSYFFHHSV